MGSSQAQAVSLPGVVHVLLMLAPVFAAPAQDELADLSLEQLLEVEVTSVSKNVQPQFDAPAAVYTLSQSGVWAKATVEF